MKIDRSDRNLLILIVAVAILLRFFFVACSHELEDSIWYESPAQENYRIHQECALGYRSNEDFCNSPEIKNPKVSAWDKRYIEKKYPELF